MAPDRAVSPLAPGRFPDMVHVEGVQLFTAALQGDNGRRNLLLARLDEGTTVAGVLTTSNCPSAPVDWCRKNLPGGLARGLVVNAGNANAFVGHRGERTVAVTASAAAELLQCATETIFVSSTGVIGEPLDPEPIVAALKSITAHRADFRMAADAIRTTDTFPKGASACLNLDGASIAISGIAKGSGMIAPDMATMLSYIFTDMPVCPKILNTLLQRGIQKSFNAITVDSDMSTSDTCLVFATGTAVAKGVSPLESMDDPRCEPFAQGLDSVLKELALQIIRDGEGITKLIICRVTGATSNKSAARIARSVAESPLVKTAVAGEDANWGRVVMAVGKAGEPADRDKLTIRFGTMVLAEKGYRAAGYSEQHASRYMKGDEIEIGVDLGLGAGEATIYGCDLTHDYVSINGDYRS